MKNPKKFKEIKQQKSKKGVQWLIFWVVAILVLFFVAAMMYIGVGDAEWAGMTVSNLTPGQAMEYNIPEKEQGVVVNYVEEQAYYSGVQRGDLLKAINGKPVRSVGEFLKVARGVDINSGVLLDILRHRKPIYISLQNKLGLHGKLKEAFGAAPPSSSGSGSHGGASMAMVAMTTAAPPPAGHLPTPKEQGAAKKILWEGHWLGMETMELAPELATEYKIPAGVKGVLVDEVSLEAAESGLLAGDMVQAIDGVPTPDLAAFTEATRRVKNKNSAEMLVSRQGYMLKLKISAERALGFSQNEAASPIPPGSISPHRTRSKPCTACHIIMQNGGQLAIDAGDILPNPPPIKEGAVPIHENRGKCKNCHVILQ
jgi:hypothetical protein